MAKRKYRMDLPQDRDYYWYILNSNQCDAFYIRETKNILSTRMNSHQTFIKNPDNLLIQFAIHTKSLHFPFNSC